MFSGIILKETKGNYDIENKLLYAPAELRNAICSPVVTPKEKRYDHDS